MTDLSVNSFFTHYAYHCNCKSTSQLSNTEKTILKIAQVASAILSLGLIPLICHKLFSHQITCYSAADLPPPLSHKYPTWDEVAKYLNQIKNLALRTEQAKNYLQFFPDILDELKIPRESDRVELAKLFFAKTPHLIQDHMEKFQIQDKKTLFELAKFFLKIDETQTIKGIHHFKIESEEEGMEIVNLCSSEYILDLAYCIKKLHISSKSNILKIAKDAISSCPYPGFVKLIDDEEIRIELCKFFSARWPLEISDQIDDFQITNEEVRRSFAKSTSRSCGASVAQSIEKYKLAENQTNPMKLYAVCCAFIQPFPVHGKPLFERFVKEDCFPAITALMEQEPLWKEKLTGWDSFPWDRSLGNKLCKLWLIMHETEKTPSQRDPALFFELIDLRNASLFFYCLNHVELLTNENLWGEFLHFSSTIKAPLPLLPLVKWIKSAEEEALNITEIVDAFKQLKQFFKNGPDVESYLALCEDLDGSPLSSKEKISLISHIVHALPQQKRKEALRKRIELARALLMMEQFPLLKECGATKNLSRALEESLEKHPYIDFKGIDQLTDKWMERISQTRSPYALLIYAGALEKTKDPTLQLLYTQLVRNILEGGEQVARYETKSAHIAKIKTVNPELWEQWSLPGKAKEVRLTEVGQELFSFGEFLEQKYKDGHMTNTTGKRLEKLIAHFSSTTLGDSESKEDEDDFEEALISLCKEAPLPKQILANRLKTILSKVRTELDDLEFKNDLTSYLKMLEQPSKASETLYVVNTDHWIDLLLSGTEVYGSCQRIIGDFNYNKALLNYIIDGKNRMIALKNSKGTIVARMLFRLLWDETEQRPVLFMDRMYVSSSSSTYYPALKQFAKEESEALGIPLYGIGSSEDGTPDHKIVSLGSVAPFEYEDAAGGLTQGIFTINTPVLIN
jgi:hypothetical protein